MSNCFQALRRVFECIALLIKDRLRRFRCASHGISFFFLFGLMVSVSSAADVYWTNAAGGNWNVAANWSGGTVPGPGDNAFIISNGTYTVTLNVNATLRTLTVGAPSGTQTLSNNASTLIVGTNGFFDVNGVLNLNGGTVGGTNTILGVMNWRGGALSGSHFIASNAVLNISGSPSKNVQGTLTNAGTMTLNGSGAFGMISGVIYNSGLFDLQSEASVSSFGGLEFRNSGIIRKTAGTGITTFGTILRNTGLVHVQSGEIDFSAGGNFGGTFTADAGKTIQFIGGTITFDTMPNFTGPGTIQFSIPGPFIRFTEPITNFTLSGGELTGTNLVIGTLNWTGGSMSGLCIVSNNATLTMSGSLSKNVKGTLTNAGTMTLSGSGAFGIISGVIYNSGLFDLQSDAAVSSFNNLDFVNSGIIRKTGGTGTTLFATILRNTGVVEVQSGQIDFSYGGSFGGTFSAESGRTIRFISGTITFDATPNFTGPGTFQFTVPGPFIRFTAPITNFTLSGGELIGTNIVIGTLNWTGGSVSGVCIVSNDATLSMSGSLSKNVKGILTNAGTMTLTGTGAFGMVSGAIYNSGLFELLSEAAVSSFGGFEFRNSGTIRKSAGVGTTTFSTFLRNTGLVQGQSGTIDFTVAGNLGGNFTASPGAAILLSGVCTFDAMPDFFGAVQFGVNAQIFFTVPITNFTHSGGILSGINTITGTLNWVGGTIGGISTIAPGAVVNVSGGGPKGFGNCTVTNFGTMNISATGLIGGLKWLFYNQSGALFDIQSDLTINGFADAELRNAGMVRKSAGPGTATVFTPLRNTGSVEVQSGILDFGRGGNPGGTFTASPGQTVLFTGNCSFDAMPNFTGNVQFGVNTLFFFTVPIGDFTLTSGILSGTNTVTGTLNWTGGRIGGQFKVATNGVLNVLGVGAKSFGNMTFTNEGTIALSGTGALSGLSWRLFNQPGALFDVQADTSIDGFGDAYIFNLGILRKSAGAGATTFYLSVTNAGTIEAQRGFLSFDTRLILLPSSSLTFVGFPKAAGDPKLGGFGAIKTLDITLNGVANIETVGLEIVAGDVFQVFQWRGQSGGFSVINGLDAEEDNYFQAVCEATAMNLFARTKLIPPPVPTTNLVNQTTSVGRNAVFCLTPLGAEPFTYQWSFNGSTLTDETNGCLLISSATTNNAGSYCVLVTDALNVANTYCATATVLIPPVILTPPTNRTIALTSNATFSVMAMGSPPLQYQWRLNGANVPGATNSTFAITNSQPRDGGSYSVVVANSVGVVSSLPVLLTVNTNALPFADNFAARGTIAGRSGAGLGTNITATKEAGEPNHAGKPGGKSLWLQWTAPTNGVAVFNARGSSFDTLLAVYSNTTVLAATITNLIAATDEDRGGFFTSEAAFNARAGSNYIIAVDGFHGATGTVVLAWLLDTNITEAPRIIQQPVNTTVSAGGDAVFNVFASSSTNLTYQWYFNCCLAIPGGTNVSYTNFNVDVLDLGYYTVEVTAGGQRVRSAEATLEIGPDNQLQSQDKLEDLFDANGTGSGLAKHDPKGIVSVAGGTINSQLINTTGSSTQARETNHCEIIGGASRWFQFKPTTNGTFMINTIGSSVDTILAVYTGSNFLNLNFVTCDDNSAPDRVRSLVRFPATSGVQYVVAVDSVGGLPGIIQVNWGLGSAPVLNVTPTNFSAGAGGTLTFNVAPTNNVDPAPGYQWYLNQARIFGATNQFFSLTNLSSRQGGRYSVIVSNFIGTLTSLVATVNVPPVFVVNGFAETVNGARQFRLNASASEAAQLQATTNFAEWQPLLTNQVPNAPFTFTDTSASNFPLRFYRVVPFP